MLRRADDAWAIQMERKPKDRKPLVLIGIVCDEEIKNFIPFKVASDKGKMVSGTSWISSHTESLWRTFLSVCLYLNKEVKVPSRKRDQLSLNSDHTHFIIIREQASTSLASNISVKKPETGEKPEKLADSMESATNRFRDVFENFLHEEDIQIVPTTNPDPETKKSGFLLSSAT